MIRFNSDYLEGAHPDVLRRLTETNAEQTCGYGMDEYCAAAADKIRAACENPDAEIYFLVGGTQTNTTVIASMLRPHQGVLAPVSGHISVHEGNGVEGAGHKVLTLPAHDGKLRAEDVEKACIAWDENPAWEHTVKPGMVYISHPTETGTLYTKKELTELRAVCDRWHLPIYLDGARLACALGSDETDLTLPDIARLCDVFYIGGTKCGALFGEAVVIRDKGSIAGFRNIITQRGALLAKGRLLGLQFDALFTDDLYFRIGRREVEQALRVRDGFREKGYPFMNDSPTNQQFPILSTEQIGRLSRDFSFEDFGPADETHRVCRFCTSWATRDEDIDALLCAI